MNSHFFEVSFWIAAALVIYVYFGYPFLLGLFSRRRKTPALPNEQGLPVVTLLISAYNEKPIIANKLQNALALDYPRSCLDILVVSDCSDDGTDEIVLLRAADGIRLVRSAERLGKSAGLNLGVREARGDILVFSDANAIYEPDAIRMLVRHFSDPRVGYVVGNARYVEHLGQPASAQSEGLYWKLETWLKEKESDFGSVVGGDGAIYAIRRELFTPLLPTDINDFLNPLQIIVSGYRGSYERSAVCYEEAGDSFEKEFRRKVRIISRSLNAVRRAPRTLLPWTQPRHWLALVSHKILRWLTIIFLFVLFLLPFLLWHSLFYRAVFFLQLGFYSLALLGRLRQNQKTSPRFLYLPYYFCLTNLASLFGVMKFLTGSLSPTWQTVREISANPDGTTHGSKREREESDQ